MLLAFAFSSVFLISYIVNALYGCPVSAAVSMGRRNTDSKSTCRGLNS
jgi:hypothetical protein